ncbi:MAG: ribosome maturation factor RimM [Gammaproteobacteria bacterium]|nr:ribosome maturation factor RimM [Gammaproteobacteria bacterium]MBU1647104.1 ribosome maturation factor RimM [Gammaproteobacteria bacterium]MBU1972616.1 ribosome maturation factor RimM [Gammaproteobacteria bacterium]
MVVLGRIVAPFGVQGWIKLFPLGDVTDDLAAWREMPAWWLTSDPDGTEWQRYELDVLKLHGKGLVAKLRGVDDRTAAEALGRSYVGAPREALPAPRDGEYYWADLIGLEVVNALGVKLGTVAELIETGANDVLVVREGKTERLLPFIAQVVREVDVPAGVIRVEWEADW